MGISLNDDFYEVNSNNDTIAQIGSIIISVRQNAPNGYLLCDGSNSVSRLIYSNLFNAIVPNKGLVLIASGSPCVLTLNGHGFLTGESIFLTTNGTLPTGLTTDTLYWIIVIDNNSFRLANSYANAISNSAINTSGTQTGVHNLFFCPYGLGNNTGNFKLPDFKNATIRGRGQGNHPNYASPQTTRLGYVEDDAFQGHHYRYGTNNSTYAVGWDGAGGGSNWNQQNNYTPGSGSGNLSSLPQGLQSDGPNGTPRASIETRMKNQGVNFFIKF